VKLKLSFSLTHPGSRVSISDSCSSFSIAAEHRIYREWTNLVEVRVQIPLAAPPMRP
jgi:hypothetical protein